MSNEWFGQSTHAGWSPGMESSVIDHLLVRPQTSWRGVRGVRAYFGAESEAAEEEADRLAMEQADDEFWDLSGLDLELADLDEVADLDADEEDDMFLLEEAANYGRLYRAQDYEMVSASEGDAGALMGRSGSSGYRGGRPTFGAELKVGPSGLEYSGNEVAAVALGFAFFAVAAKGMRAL